MRRTVLLMAALTIVAAVLPPSGPASASSGSDPVPFELGGEPCALISVPPGDTAAPVGVGTCPGVRPGARVITDLGQCTLNFLFGAPDGERYMGTAGHCIQDSAPVAGDDIGESLWAPGEGPVARNGAGLRIGEFAYAVLASPKDFALIRLDPEVEASPEMCHFGPPSGEFEGLSEEITILEYFGLGIGIGTVLPARSAVALGVPDENHVRAAGFALPGDSGSGVMTRGGQAIGVLVTVGFHSDGISDLTDVGTIGITRLGPQVERAEEALGTALALVTVPA